MAEDCMNNIEGLSAAQSRMLLLDMSPGKYRQKSKINVVVLTLLCLIFRSW